MYVSQLFSATKGSAGLDLASSKDYELTEIHKVYLIGTNVYGPLPKGLVGLIIGRSSVTLKGLNVHIGVIDSDYLGEIKIMVSTGSYSVITTGQRLAQLLLLPYTVPQSHQTSRGKEGFGSTNVLDVYWSTSISQQKPKQIKTDNGPGYTGKAIKTFLLEWNIIHTTGIPHNPTGQAMIERAHLILKLHLKNKKGGIYSPSHNNYLKLCLH